MKIKFVGAVGGQVTGSCTLCCAQSGIMFLVDCGSFQGGMNAESLNAGFPFDPRKISFVLLTHAHLDHCGRIPDLYKSGFAGKIVCSEATKELSILQFKDMQRIKGEDSFDKKYWEDKFFIPEYDMGFHPLDCDIFIYPVRSSHILGAWSFVVSWRPSYVGGRPYQGAREICFSGDLGSVVTKAEENHLPFLKHGKVPWGTVDYFVLESTYGANDRDPEKRSFEGRTEKLREVISDSRFDAFVIACFSMQRTQDVLFDLHYIREKHGVDFDIKLESPLGKSCCKIYKKLLSDKNLCACRLLEKRFGMESEALAKKIFCDEDVKNDVSEKNEDKNGKRRTVYITSSGMFAGGPVMNRLHDMHSDPKVAFVLTGYQSAKNGRQIKKWADVESAEERKGDISFEISRTGQNGDQDDENGDQNEKNNLSVTIEGKNFHAGIIDISSFYSGHADWQGICRFLFETEKGKESKMLPESASKTKNVAVFLNHGDSKARASLKEKIEQENRSRERKMRNVARVMLPGATDPFFDLDKGDWDGHFSPPSCFYPFCKSGKRKIEDKS